jgi:hypothetical protein
VGCRSVRSRRDGSHLDVPFEHTETDEAAEFLGYGALEDHFAGRFGLEEAHPVLPDYPERQPQPARSPEELLSHLVCIQRRVPNGEITIYYLESRI